MKTVKEYKIVPVKGNNIEKKKITTSGEAFNVIKNLWHDDIEIYESFFILLLNRANDTIGWAKISQGGIVGTYVDKKIICKYVVDSLASGIILAHNHPSGSMIASKEDLNVTKDLKDCLKVFDCKVYDHLILTPDGRYYSMADQGDI